MRQRIYEVTQLTKVIQFVCQFFINSVSKFEDLFRCRRFPLQRTLWPYTNSELAIVIWQSSPLKCIENFSIEDSVSKSLLSYRSELLHLLLPTLALQYLNLSEFDDDSFQSVSFLGHFSHPFKSCIGSNSHTIRWMTFGGRIIAHKYVSRAQFPDCLLDHPLRILFLSDIRLQGDLCHLGHWRCPHF